MISVENIQKKYNGTFALDGFSLQIQQGELFGIVGPNGAGKTTLIKILATLLRPTSGKVTIGGFDVSVQKKNVKALVGYMPDSPGIYQEMRVREYFEFFADAFDLKHERRASAVEQALVDSKLRERSESFVEELSLGMRQCLLLAKTLLHGPKVLLLDEPATGLDPIARIELREELKRLNREGVTVLISSHILNDLEDICTRVAFIAQGKNAADPQGNSIMNLRKVESTVRRYEITLMQNIDQIQEKLGRAPKTKMISAKGNCAVVEVEGEDAEAAALVRYLVELGAGIVAFVPASDGLEERYRQTFGGTHA